MESLIYKLFIDAKRSKDLKAMKSLLNGYPNDSTIKFEYAKMLIPQRKYEEAKQLFLELLDTRNANYAMLELGKMECYTGNNEKAREYFNKLAESGDKYAAFELARLDIQEKKYYKAKKELKELLPYKVDGVMTELGRLEAIMGNIGEAKRIFKVMEEKIHDPHGTLELGKLELSMGNFETARDIFSKLLKTKLYLSARIELGLVEAHSGNYKGAEKYFLELLDTPVNMLAYRLLSLLYIKMQDYLKAYKIIKEALANGADINPYVIMDVTKKLNVILDTDYNNIHYNYSMDQLLDYDDYLGLDHVMHRHGENPNRDFNEDIDVPLLFNSIKRQLKPEYIIKSFNYNDLYVIDYPNAGKHGENYIKVVTLPNTKDIITMYPVATKYEFSDEIEEDLTNKEKML